MTDVTETNPEAGKAETAEQPKAAAKKAAPSKPGTKKPALKTASAATKRARKTTATKKTAAKPAPKKTATKKATSAKPKTVKAAVAKTAAAQTKVGNTMNQTIETMTSASNDAMKEGLEKTLNAVNEASAFHKDTVDAVIESATVAGKGIETVNANAVAYAKAAMEEGVAVTKAVASAKSVQEMFEIQSDYAKSSMDTYLSELNKTSELFSDLFKNSFKPLNDRVSAAVDLAQSQR